MFYTYILRSIPPPEQRYIGSTADLKSRLAIRRFFASSTVYDKNSYLFCAWNFRQLYRFLLVTFAKQMPQLISQNGQWRTETDDNRHGFQKNCPYLSVLSPFKSVRSPRVIHQINQGLLGLFKALWMYFITDIIPGFFNSVFRFYPIFYSILSQTV